MRKIVPLVTRPPQAASVDRWLELIRLPTLFSLREIKVGGIDGEPAWLLLSPRPFNVLSLFNRVTAFLLAAFLLLLAWSIYYHFSTTEVSPGICQPLKVRFLHISVVMVFGLNYVFWKIGLCRWLAMVRFMFDGIPPFNDPTLSIKNTYFEGVFVRIYQPKEPSVNQRRGIVYIHGGSGIMGSIDAYERLCRYIAKESNSVLVSVGYHVAPESPYPSQFNECHDATVHFMKNAENYGVDPARIIICGDSFGGTVTAYLCQELKSRTDLPKVRAQVLLYPFLQALDPTLPSYQQNCFNPFISRIELLKFAARYFDTPISIIGMAIAGNLMPENLLKKYSKWVHSEIVPFKFRIRNHNPALPPSSKDNLFNVIIETQERKLSPLLADDFFLEGLPETFILTCEYDVLRDDGLLYKKRLEDNGVSVLWHHLEDAFHSILVLLDHWFVTFPCAKTGTDVIVNYMKTL
ncbi:arylacetamide deacetylase-like 4 [Heteronotia binoei]|uniref:arylacetamide deacetylase-like 4 n=1 Tax=Heteronotia binoei TaxID=13085 RepID=UPI0029307284|nr:arylacetamide deacetylase-like 4 [Heteronotia binoei]